MNKMLLRPLVEEVVLAAQEQGLDLVSDYVHMRYSYPDMPLVEINITIGGMFTNMVEDELH